MPDVNRYGQHSTSATHNHFWDPLDRKYMDFSQAFDMEKEVPAIRADMAEATNTFHVLIKTLLKAGIITDRTRGVYAAYVDMAELYAEGDRMVGDDIAEEGIKYLVALNGGKMTIPSLMAAE